MIFNTLLFNIYKNNDSALDIVSGFKKINNLSFGSICILELLGINTLLFLEIADSR